MKPSLISLVLLGVLVPASASARRAVWGERATAEQTSAGIDKTVAKTTSALRKQFGAAVAGDLEATDARGRAQGDGEVEHERVKGRGQSRERIQVARQRGSQEVVRSRQINRSKGQLEISSLLTRRDAATGTESASQRSVSTDGSRRPKTVAVRTNDQSFTADEGDVSEASSEKIYKTSGWGRKGKLVSSSSTVTRLGAFASEGNQAEQETTTQSGKTKVSEKTTVANNGVKRTVKTLETRRLGGLFTTTKVQAFAPKGRNGKEKLIGTSRSFKMAGRDVGVGRQRADRAQPWGQPRGQSPSGRMARR